MSFTRNILSDNLYFLISILPKMKHGIYVTINFKCVTVTLLESSTKVASTSSYVKELGNNYPH